MKKVTLDWQGWWLLRSPMASAPELGCSTAVVAVLAAKLKKTGGKVISAGREPVLFHAFRGGVLRTRLEELQEAALGAFVRGRCSEIRKQAILYIAPLPDTTDEAELSAIVSLLSGSVPFAPRHHAMPAPYTGEPMVIENRGRNVGLQAEIGAVETVAGDASKTLHPDSALSHAIAQELALNPNLTSSEREISGLETERVPKPDDLLVQGAAFTPDTDRVDKPPGFERGPVVATPPPRTRKA